MDSEVAEGALVRGYSNREGICELSGLSWFTVSEREAAVSAREAAVREAEADGEDQGGGAAEGTGAGDTEVSRDGTRTSTDIKLEQKAFRGLVLKGIAGDGPLGDLIVMRRVVEPHRVLMKDLLYHSGRGWEERQAAAEARSIMGGEAGMRLRSYRGILAAQGVLEKKELGVWKINSEPSDVPSLLQYLKTIS